MNVNYDSMWSAEGAALLPSTLSGFVSRFAGKTDVVKMHVGLPPDITFPLRWMSVGTNKDETVEINDANKISEAQQYNFGPGHGDLLDWVQRLMSRCHSPTIPFKVVISAGAVHAISNIISVLADRGDSIVVDEFAYVHVTECILVPKGLKMLPVKADASGMDPEELDATLIRARTSAEATGRKPPRLLYTVPSGQNPTGIIMSLERKRQIYSVCQKHDVVIIEDDAYYWLQFYSARASLKDAEGSCSIEEASPRIASEEERQAVDVPGLDLPASFLSIDTDSRVIRVDTLSKLMGPGFRIGWVTCAPQLAAKLAMAIQGNCVGPSSLSMVLLSELIKSWGDARFEDFVREGQGLYRIRAEAACRAASEHLSGLVEYIAPRAGMFMWLKFTGLEDFDEVAESAFVDQGVACVPGRLFWADHERASLPGSKCPYMRVSFGGLDECQIDEGFRRIGEAIRHARR